MTQHSNPSLFKQTMCYSIGMVIYLGCQWLTNLLITRMDLSAGGLLSLAIAVTNPFSAITLYSMKAYQVSDIENRFPSGVYVASRLITMAAGVIFCIIAAPLAGYSGQTLTAIIMYMVLRLIEALVDVFQAIQQKGGRLDIVGRSFVMRGVLSTAAFFVTIFFSSNLALAILSMALISLGVVLLYDLPRAGALAPVRPVFDWSSLRGLLIACSALTLNTFLVSKIASLPGTTLESAWGGTVMGIYGALATPCVIVQTSGSFLFNPLIPDFSRNIQARQKKAVYRSIWRGAGLIILISLTAVLLGMILGEWAIELVFGSKVAAHTPVMLTMLAASGLTTLTWFMALILTVMRHYRGLITSNLLALGVAYAACRLLIPSGGLQAAPWALIIALLIQGMSYAFQLARECRRRFA